jgi:zinc/manganese transport system permease protein
MGLLAEIGYQSDWWAVMQTGFMRHALAAGLLVAAASGIVGYFVVVRRDTFAAHALAHIGFPGATGAALLGMPVTFGLLAFCVGGGLVIGALGKRADRRDVATGSVLALAMALGLLFNSMATRRTGGLTAALFGNLLAISTGQLTVFAVLTLVVVATLAVISRPLLLASIDPKVAEAKGVPVRGLGTVFLVLLAVTVVMAVQVVGTLLLFALVVTPAAAALTWTPRPTAVVAGAVGIGSASVVGGLGLAVMFNLPPSFPIVTLAFVVWLAALATTRSKPRGRGGHIDPHHREPADVIA